MSKSITHLQDIDIPLLPLRSVVVFPHLTAHIEVGRKSSIDALDAIDPVDKLIILSTQKDASSEDISPQSLYPFATLARVRSRNQQQDGLTRVIVEGLFRVQIKQFQQVNHYWTGCVEVLTDRCKDTLKLDQLIDELLQLLKEAIVENKSLAHESFKKLDRSNPAKIIDLIVSKIGAPLSLKYKLLKQRNTITRAQVLMRYLEHSTVMHQLDRKLEHEVKRKINRNQKEYFLHEKMRVIKNELGEDDSNNEIDTLTQRINESKLPPHAFAKAQAELKKIKNIPPQSPEYSVIINYLDTLLNLPWNESNEVSKDINQAAKILDKDHYGLEEVKSHILEHLAVQTRSDNTSATIICLLGPPGVGKTSLAASIAKATGREYVRMALGGVRDEAEIRGHRRTYIGAMCGKILQKLTQAKSNNPLFLLDEIDKLSADFRGDPASALLEVLDPEQNKQFNDHYLNLDFDLSKVLFLSTSNSYRIPAPLLDRMEIIELSGYTDIEKEQIAKNYLLPKQKTKNSIKPKELKLTQNSIRYIIENYTREAGVRSLERLLAKICRKTVYQSLTDNKATPILLNKDTINELLGAAPYRYHKRQKHNQIGEVTGLAWNQVGGDTLTIECLNYPGTGRLVCTGKLGEVMQESIRAALSYVRSQNLVLGIDADSFKKSDIHVHVPEGATPKDGPSAGVAIAVAIASSYSENPVNANVAMTGEITLRGDVLAIGGLKQKLLAAQRSKMDTVLIPEQNEHELIDIPGYIKEGLNIIAIKRVENAFNLALEKPLHLSKRISNKQDHDIEHIH